MWISSLFQTGMRKLLILGLVSSLTACGGGGGGGKKPDPVPPSSGPVSSSSSSLLSSSLDSSSISSLGNSSSNSTSSLVAPADTTPDSFSFPAVTGAALNTNVTSAAIIITGINTAVPISIANGEYSIDGGAFTGVAGTVSNGQTVSLRLLSATSVARETQATVTIGDITRSFSVTTTNLLGGTVQGAPLNIAGVVTTIAGTPPGADGTGATARFSGAESIASDGTYLYVADTQNHKIRKIEVSTGVVTTIAGNGSGGSADGPGATASFRRPRGITSDGTNLYVADSDNSKIRKIEIATGVVTTLAGGSLGSTDGTGAAASFNQPYAITTDGTNLYVADTYNNKIRKIVIATGVVTTLAGTGSGGSNDGTGSVASFNTPGGITNDGTHLYVADTYNNKIRKIVIATGVVTTLAGSGSHGSTDGTGAAAKFSYPKGIITHGANLYVAASNKIRKIEIATGIVTTFAEGSDAEDLGAAANFSYAGGITIYGAHMYVTNSKIHSIEIATGVVTTLAGGDLGGGVDGAGTAASFHQPYGITSDGTYLYVADSTNHKIRKIEIATGIVATLAGSGTEGSADGTGMAASFRSPHGITTLGPHLYVTDSGNHKIRKIVIASGMVTTLAGSGSSGSVDGKGVAANFGWAEGITTEGTDLYVADTSNHKIRKIEIATGVVTTLAGSASAGSADGSGVEASFNGPAGITTDGTHLHVADTSNHKIRKIEIATGVVTTLAGRGSSGSGDGTGAAASFQYPSGITTDGTHLYIADTVNFRIRKIVIATGVVTTLAGEDAGGGDGMGARASFGFPVAITSDGFSLFVTDSNNNTIRKIE